MTTGAEVDALMAAWHRWYDARITDEDRLSDQVASSRARALARDAFRAGWTAANRYAERQGGPG